MKGPACVRLAAPLPMQYLPHTSAVFTVTVEAQERTESGLTHVRYSKLNLIDLAGEGAYRGGGDWTVE